MSEPLPVARPRPRCDACLHFVSIAGDAYKGECRRYPPTPYSAMNSAFATTAKNASCGEHAARSVEQAVPEPVSAKGNDRKRGR